MSGQHPGLANLAPHQREFLDAFLRLEPQRAVLDWPVGVGKTTVGATLADLVSPEGLVLIVTPAGSLAYWADRTRALQRADPVMHDRAVTVIDRHSAEYLRALRNATENDESAGFSHSLLIVSTERATRGEWADLLGQIRWRLVVVDEAHRLLRREAGTRLVTALEARSKGLLLMGSQLDRSLPGAHHFGWKGDSTVFRHAVGRQRQLPVAATEAERAFVEALAGWHERAREPFSSYALRIALLNPLAAVGVLERALGSRAAEEQVVMDEGEVEVALQSQADPETLSWLVDLGDALEPPGSKSSRAIDVATEGTLSVMSFLVVATLVQDVFSIEAGVAATGRTVESVSSSMEPDERIAAATRMRDKRGVLVVSDAALSEPVAAGFPIVLHRDAGLTADRLNRRLALLAGNQFASGRFQNLVVVWPQELERLAVRAHGWESLV